MPVARPIFVGEPQFTACFYEGVETLTPEGIPQERSFGRAYGSVDAVCLLLIGRIQQASQTPPKAFPDLQRRQASFLKQLAVLEQLSTQGFLKIERLRGYSHGRGCAIKPHARAAFEAQFIQMTVTHEKLVKNLERISALIRGFKQITEQKKVIQQNPILNRVVSTLDAEGNPVKSSLYEALRAVETVRHAFHHRMKAACADTKTPTLEDLKAKRASFLRQFHTLKTLSETALNYIAALDLALKGNECPASSAPLLREKVTEMSAARNTLHSHLTEKWHLATSTFYTYDQFCDLVKAREVEEAAAAGGPGGLSAAAASWRTLPSGQSDGSILESGARPKVELGASSPLFDSFVEVEKPKDRFDDHIVSVNSRGQLVSLTVRSALEQAIDGSEALSTEIFADIQRFQAGAGASREIANCYINSKKKYDRLQMLATRALEIAKEKQAQGFKREAQQILNTAQLLQTYLARKDGSVGLRLLGNLQSLESLYQKSTEVEKSLLAAK